MTFLDNEELFRDGMAHLPMGQRPILEKVGDATVRVIPVDPVVAEKVAQVLSDRGFTGYERADIPPIKMCETCAYMKGDDFRTGVCMRSAESCTLERKLTSYCGKEFDGWVPAPPKPPVKGIVRRFIEWTW